MKLAYLGNWLPEFSTENDVRKAFEYLGWQVVKLQENAATWQQVREVALASDLVLVTSTWDDVQPFRESVETFRLCAMKGIPTATLHLDVFWGTSRGGRPWWRNIQFFTRYVFSADGDHQTEWDRMGVSHYWLPPGVRHTAVHRGSPRPEYTCDVALIGSDGRGYHEAEWPYRRELAEHLVEMCARNGWTYRNPGGRDPKVDRGEALNDFYASAKVTVGDSLCLKKEASHYFSDRQFESWGRGGLLIMPRLDILHELMEGNQPTYEWGDWSDLESKVTRYLADPDERRRITALNLRLVADRHTYVNRVGELLRIVGR